MLQIIPNHSSFTWQCLGGEEDEYCEKHNTCELSEVEYRSRRSPKGRITAEMVLPPCECGAQTFLKADYTVKELCTVVQPVQNEHGVIWAYVLPLRYVRNVRLHWLLYEQGRAEHAPVLPMPPQALLEQPQMAAHGDVDVTCALWFGWLAVRERQAAVGSPNHVDVPLLEGATDANTHFSAGEHRSIT